MLTKPTAIESLVNEVPEIKSAFPEVNVKPVTIVSGSSTKRSDKTQVVGRPTSSRTPAKSKTISKESSLTSKLMPPSPAEKKNSTPGSTTTAVSSRIVGPPVTESSALTVLPMSAA